MVKSLFLFSKGAGRGSEIFHIRMSQKHKRGENRVVDVDDKKETLITWLFSWYKMVISKMFKFRNKNTYNDYMKSVIRGFWCY